MEQSIATTQIFNANCLEKMKDLDDDSVDLIFCDLPYNQTSCKWDVAIDLELFWKQVMRIKKLHTPLFFTTTTKFGVSLIQSAPKKCYFRYDLVWVKSAPAGFLCAKKMPMRKHEMIYVFYEKLPLYDLSSHKHKFIKEVPVSVVKEEEHNGIIHSSGKVGITGQERKKPLRRAKKGEEKQYDPPLPVSVVKEDVYDSKERFKNGKLKKNPRHLQKGDEPIYDPALPVSVVKEEYIQPDTYGKNSNKEYNSEFAKKNNYNKNQVLYDPPLPTTMLEIKSTRGKHSTEKPVQLMEWIFKYYSKEGDTILDPTMGSGSTGVACKNMNRNFIGIEMDEDIFKVAQERLNIKTI